MAKDTNGCGTKHFKLACWLIFPLLGLVVTITTATASYQAGVMRDQDVRIRANEQGRAASDAQFEAIKRSLERIERQLEKGTP